MKLPGRISLQKPILVPTAEKPLSACQCIIIGNQLPGLVYRGPVHIQPDIQNRAVVKSVKLLFTPILDLIHSSLKPLGTRRGIWAGILLFYILSIIV